MGYLEMARAFRRTEGVDSEILSDGSREVPAVEPRTPDSAEAIPIGGLVEAGLAVTVRSELLGREVLFVSDDVPEEAFRDLQGVVDRARELRALESDKPLARHLRTVHAGKKISTAVIGGA